MWATFARSWTRLLRSEIRRQQRRQGAPVPNGERGTQRKRTLSSACDGGEVKIVRVRRIAVGQVMEAHGNGEASRRFYDS